MLKSKSKHDFTSEQQSIFKLLTINGKYNVIGSAGLKGILYNSDFDLKEEINPIKTLRKTFINKMQTAKKIKGIYITDFKCGNNERTKEPLRWNLKKLIADDNEGYSFKEAINQKGLENIIKMDCVALLDGVFYEITENYILHTNHPKMSQKDLINDLKNSQKEYIDENNYWKALKREFSIYKLLNNKKGLEQLLSFFNSYVGIIAKAVSELDILLLVLEQTFKKVNLKDIYHNLQLIKYRLSNVYEVSLKMVSDRIDSICKIKDIKQLEKYIEELKDYLFEFVNGESKKIYNKKRT